MISAAAALGQTFATRGVEPSAWDKILGSVGLARCVDESAASVLVLGGEETGNIQALAASKLVILEGTGAAAKSLGFTVRGENLLVRRVEDIHAPGLPILWAQPVQLPVVQVPGGFRVLAREKWRGAPLTAAMKVGSGGILWLANSPGATGIERYPYLLQAAIEFGLQPPARGTNLWAFFDSAYRIRADPDYLARRWREAGISVLHAAAWHNMEPDAAQDAFLEKLIEACHRHAILVYAWFELPHVSEKFWADHPEWRDKTAMGQDAQLDWRKLMNLQNPECKRAVEESVAKLMERFDWDGINMAELYFESLEGAGNPARFTPMNEDVRAAFRAAARFDPKELFDAGSARAAGKNAAGLRQFLDFRAGLAAQMQTDWLEVCDRLKKTKPHLDAMLTHIDDRFEPGIRDALGADVARVLPALEKRRQMLLIEDPATLWNLGPDRYRKLGEKYAELTRDGKNLAIDINVVERYQDVYPTKKQTGVELTELVHQAATSFRRVALYVENSLEKQDLPLLPYAASTATVTRPFADEWRVENRDAVRIAWRGPVELDGRLWPVGDEASVLVPAGKHVLRPGLETAALRIADFNGDLRSATVTKTQLDFGYHSRGRALANIKGPVGRVEVDGVEWNVPGLLNAERITSFVLPAGQHLVTVTVRQ